MGPCLVGGQGGPNIPQLSNKVNLFHELFFSSLGENDGKKLINFFKLLLLFSLIRN